MEQDLIDIILDSLPDLKLGNLDVTAAAWGLISVGGLISAVWIFLQVVATLKTIFSPSVPTQQDFENFKKDVLDAVTRNNGDITSAEEAARREDAVKRTIKAEPKAAREIARGELTAGFDELEKRARAKTVAAAQEWRDLAILSQDREPQRALRAWRESVKLDETDFWAWVYLARLELYHDADLIAARAASERALSLARNDRDRGIALNDIGTVDIIAGNLEAARGRWEECLSIARMRVAERPESEEVLPDLCAALSHLGDVEVRSGHLGDALRYYEESLSIARGISAQNPESPHAHRDLCVSLTQLGETERAMGNLPRAREYFYEALKIAEVLSKFRADNAAALQDLNVSHMKVGDAELECENLIEARRHFEKSLEIARSLSTASPESAEARRNVTVSLTRLGNLEVKCGNSEIARSHFEQGLDIVRGLLMQSSGSARGKRDVVISLIELGALTSEVDYSIEALAIVQNMKAGHQLAPRDEFLLEHLNKQIEEAQR